jgi:hypothetical protein
MPETANQIEIENGHKLPQVIVQFHIASKTENLNGTVVIRNHQSAIRNKKG